MQNFIYTVLFIVMIGAGLAAQTPGSETVVIETPYGVMKVKLFKETPLHRANFIKLVQQKFFDSLLFHRVINSFMIQGGDPLSKKAAPGDSLGHGDLGYTIPAEFDANIIHKKGRLAAARESDDINPKFESSASQFYLVMGKKRTPEDLIKYEERINRNRRANCTRQFTASTKGSRLQNEYNRLKTANPDSAAVVNNIIEKLIDAEYRKVPEYRFSPYQQQIYTTIGGTPHLDGSYTVFGEVIEGIEVIDRIAAVKTDKRDRPVDDIRMKIYIIDK